MLSEKASCSEVKAHWPITTTLTWSMGALLNALQDAHSTSKSASPSQHDCKQLQSIMSQLGPYDPSNGHVAGMLQGYFMVACQTRSGWTAPEDERLWRVHAVLLPLRRKEVCQLAHVGLSKLSVQGLAPGFIYQQVFQLWRHVQSFRLLHSEACYLYGPA